MTDATQQMDVQAGEGQLGDYWALLKPRVMSLVVFTAAVGVFVAPVSVHPFIAFVSILFIALGGGASGALNMWYDADIDSVMKRTAKRPIPSGRVTGGEALSLGMWLSFISVVMLGLASNWVAAGILAFTIFFYVVIYTMLLKRWTPQNIVIGGAAGAFPPMIGWAVATGGVSIEAVLMFMLTFMWTPPHFWALALFTKADYSDAQVPMLTVTHGTDEARKQSLIYAGLLAVLSIAAAFTSIGGWIYLVAALYLNVKFVSWTWKMYKRTTAQADDDKFLVERKTFRFSLTYLFAIFGALLLQGIWNKLGFAPFIFGGV